LHLESLKAPPAQEEEALNLIKNLSELPDVDIVTTTPSEFPHYKIGDFTSARDVTTVSLFQNGELVHYTGIIEQFEKLQRDAAFLSNTGTIQHPDTQAVLADLIPAKAHNALSRDIFVT